MAYSELIKNFEHIRAYMSEFFIYGFKSRQDYDKKSARTYDNERRRIQSYLGDNLKFSQTSSGKNVFISIDSRECTHNPLYKAFKAKSFTAKDISLHFIILDILKSKLSCSLKEMIDLIDREYLCGFSKAIVFDESTIRKKLKEYAELGLIVISKDKKSVSYSLACDEIELEAYKDAIRFFTEENLLGVVGSYIEDRYESDCEYLSFKHHYIMNAYDSEIIEAVLRAIYEQRYIEIKNFSKKNTVIKAHRVIPLKVYVSVQGGRNYLLCKLSDSGHISSFRLDYIKNVKLFENISDFELHQSEFADRYKHIWGVVCNVSRALEHIEFDIYVDSFEGYIVRRLYREKRCGHIIKLDEHNYRFIADVYDVREMLPWIRSFFGRILRIYCTDEEIVKSLKEDIDEMSKYYQAEDI